MSLPELVQTYPKKSALIVGTVFLFLYWWVGYDGITFSDDVYYLLAGKHFWEGTMEVDSYHFSSRWGAYVPSGLIGHILGFDAHLISLISLLSYVGALAILLKALPAGSNPWILLSWFCTQVYFLHFLTKVYPDAQLAFWIALVPFSAIYRNQKPFWAALGVISGLFFGFITKETIVFLIPFPILLFLWDWKKRRKFTAFYTWLISLGILFGGLYLGYFWWKFDNALYRFQSIQDGHYISEFTYADKSIWVMLKRLSILPLQTFVERAYWPWLVFAFGGVRLSFKYPEKKGMEFSLALICLILGFWFMSTNFRFYNPLYLNPRHLIILVPILAYLVAQNWDKLRKDSQQQKLILGLMAVGILIGIFQQDWKMVLFQIAILATYFWKKEPLKDWTMALLLVIPALQSITYQQKVKAYPEFTNALKELTADSSSPILVNNFVHFSREVLLPADEKAQQLLLPIEKLDSLKPHLPNEFRVFIYEYYQHSYPKEEVDVENLRHFLNKDFQQTNHKNEGKIEISTYRIQE